MISQVVDIQLVEALQGALSDYYREPVILKDIEIDPIAYASSFYAAKLSVSLQKRPDMDIFFKDMNPENQLVDAQRVRSADMERSDRELEVYRRLLRGRNFGTPTLFGYRWDEQKNQYWLFLQFIDGKKVSKLPDLRVWEASARWVARFHHQSRALSPADTAFLPHFDAAHYQECEDKVREKIPYLDGPDRKLLERAVKAFESVKMRVVKFPQSVIHGEYFGKNIMVGLDTQNPVITAIDWETAAFGPSFLDIASLSSGDWSLDEKLRMRKAYFDQYRGQVDSGMSWEEYCCAIDDLELYQAIKWIGWWPGREVAKQFGRWMNELEKVMSELNAR